MPLLLEFSKKLPPSTQAYIKIPFEIFFLTSFISMLFSILISANDISINSRTHNLKHNAFDTNYPRRIMRISAAVTLFSCSGIISVQNKSPNKTRPSSHPLLMPLPQKVGAVTNIVMSSLWLWLMVVEPFKQVCVYKYDLGLPEISALDKCFYNKRTKCIQCPTNTSRILKSIGENFSLF